MTAEIYKVNPSIKTVFVFRDGEHENIAVLDCFGNQLPAYQASISRHPQLFAIVQAVCAPNVEWNDALDFAISDDEQVLIDHILEGGTPAVQSPVRWAYLQLCARRLGESTARLNAMRDAAKIRHCGVRLLGAGRLDDLHSWGSCAPYASSPWHPKIVLYYANL